MRNLAARGLIGEPRSTLRAKDDTLQGGLHALCAGRACPDAAAKAWAWDQLTGRQGRSNYEMVDLARGFWTAPDDALVADYVPRYFTDVPAMAAWVGEDALSRVVLVAFPRVFTDETARARAPRRIARDDLTPAVRRSLVDADAELREALRPGRRSARPSDGMATPTREARRDLVAFMTEVIADGVARTSPARTGPPGAST